MLNKDMTKSEIENFLKTKGDFVAISNLTNYLNNKELPLDKKKYAYAKLAELYEKKGMLTETARMYNNLAECSIAFSEKIKNHVAEVGYYIKAGKFDLADEATKKAMVEANTAQRAEIFVQVKEFYKKQAEKYVKEMKRGHAVRIYEKLLRMNLSDIEKAEIKEKLMPLYEKLGRLKDYFSIKENKFDSKI